MQRWRGLEAVPGSWGRCVVTIGMFDGVHRGHRAMIGRAVEKAGELGLPSVCVTFDPHPTEVVRPGSHPPLLTTPRHKADLVEALGVDVLLVLPFTPEFSRLPPDEFVHVVLVERLHAAAVVVGENFRYGAKAAGDVALLAQLGSRFGFSTDPVGMFAAQVGGQPTVLSSTFVRSCVTAGDVALAAEALGRPHRVVGTVVRGDQRGRQMGYPTANLDPVAHAAVPSDGIYAGRLVRDSHQPRAAAISIGTNPTFAGTERRIEAFVLDVDDPKAYDLYGERVGLDFVARLRDTIRFDDMDDLMVQMADDVERTRGLV